MQAQQQNNDGLLPATFDPNTEADSAETVSNTDIIPYNALGGLLEPIRDGSKLPIHDQILMNEFPDPAQREMLADFYSREPQSLKKFAGKTVRIFGMILWEQPGGWKGKDGFWHPENYFQVRMIIEDDTTKGEPLVVVKSSGAGLARHVYHILNNRGWFLFKEPIEYRVEVGEDNAHRIYNTQHDLKKIIKEKVKA